MVPYTPDAIRNTGPRPGDPDSKPVPLHVQLGRGIGMGLVRVSPTTVESILNALKPVLRERLLRSEQFTVWRIRGGSPFTVGAVATTCKGKPDSGQKGQSESAEGVSSGSSPQITQDRVMGSLRSSIVFNSTSTAHLVGRGFSFVRITGRQKSHSGLRRRGTGKVQQQGGQSL